MLDVVQRREQPDRHPSPHETRDRANSRPERHDQPAEQPQRHRPRLQRIAPRGHPVRDPGEADSKSVPGRSRNRCLQGAVRWSGQCFPFRAGSGLAETCLLVADQGTEARVSDSIPQSVDIYALTRKIADLPRRSTGIGVPQRIQHAVPLPSGPGTRQSSISCLPAGSRQFRGQHPVIVVLRTTSDVIAAYEAASA